MGIKYRTVLAQRGGRTLSWPAMGPSEEIDYRIDWSLLLVAAQDERIASVAWTKPDGITADTESNGPTQTTIWLTGGVLGGNYTFTCRIRTNWGRTFDQSVAIKVIQP
jgi:hypothetical protein